MTRLPYFLAASALLHGLLLAGGGDRARVEAGADNVILSVRLDTDRFKTPSIGTQTTPALPLPGAFASSTASSRVHTNTSPAETDAATVHRSSPDATAHVRARVLNDLARYFYYPPIARLRAWEGRVLLAFRVEADGLLHEPRLVRTSGFGVLDEAALHSLRKVVRVADAGGPRLDMEIPVIYRLTDAH